MKKIKCWKSLQTTWATDGVRNMDDISHIMVSKYTKLEKKGRGLEAVEFPPLVVQATALIDPMALNTRSPKSRAFALQLFYLLITIRTSFLKVLQDIAFQYVLKIGQQRTKAV